MRSLADDIGDGDGYGYGDGNGKGYGDGNDYGDGKGTVPTACLSSRRPEET